MKRLWIIVGLLVLGGILIMFNTPAVYADTSSVNINIKNLPSDYPITNISINPDVNVLIIGLWTQDWSKVNPDTILEQKILKFKFRDVFKYQLATTGSTKRIIVSLKDPSRSLLVSYWQDVNGNPVMHDVLPDILNALNAGNIVFPIHFAQWGTSTATGNLYIPDSWMRSDMLMRGGNNKVLSAINVVGMITLMGDENAPTVIDEQWKVMSPVIVDNPDSIPDSIPGGTTGILLLPNDLFDNTSTTVLQTEEGKFVVEKGFNAIIAGNPNTTATITIQISNTHTGITQQVLLTNSLYAIGSNGMTFANIDMLLPVGTWNMLTICMENEGITSCIEKSIKLEVRYTPGVNIEIIPSPYVSALQQDVSKLYMWVPGQKIKISTGIMPHTSTTMLYVDINSPFSTTPTMTILATTVANNTDFFKEFTATVELPLIYMYSDAIKDIILPRDNMKTFPIYMNKGQEQWYWNGARGYAEHRSDSSWYQVMLYWGDKVQTNTDVVDTFPLYPSLLLSNQYIHPYNGRLTTSDDDGSVLGDLRYSYLCGISGPYSDKRQARAVSSIQLNIIVTMDTMQKIKTFNIFSLSNSFDTYVLNARNGISYMSDSTNTNLLVPAVKPLSYINVFYDDNSDFKLLFDTHSYHTEETKQCCTHYVYPHCYQYSTLSFWDNKGTFSAPLYNGNNVTVDLRDISVAPYDENLMYLYSTNIASDIDKRYIQSLKNLSAPIKTTADSSLSYVYVIKNGYSFAYSFPFVRESDVQSAFYTQIVDIDYNSSIWEYTIDNAVSITIQTFSPYSAKYDNEHTYITISGIKIPVISETVQSATLHGTTGYLHTLRFAKIINPSQVSVNPGEYEVYLHLGRSHAIKDQSQYKIANIIIVNSPRIANYKSSIHFQLMLDQAIVSGHTVQVPYVISFDDLEAKANTNSVLFIAHTGYNPSSSCPKQAALYRRLTPEERFNPNTLTITGTWSISQEMFFSSQKHNTPITFEFFVSSILYKEPVHLSETFDVSPSQWSTWFTIPSLTSWSCENRTIYYALRVSDEWQYLSYAAIPVPDIVSSDFILPFVGFNGMNSYFGILNQDSAAFFALYTDYRLNFTPDLLGTILGGFTLVSINMRTPTMTTTTIKLYSNMTVTASRYRIMWNDNIAGVLILHPSGEEETHYAQYYGKVADVWIPTSYKIVGGNNYFSIYGSYAYTPLHQTYPYGLVWAYRQPNGMIRIAVSKINNLDKSFTDWKIAPPSLLLKQSPLKAMWTDVTLSPHSIVSTIYLNTLHDSIRNNLANRTIKVKILNQNGDYIWTATTSFNYLIPTTSIARKVGETEQYVFYEIPDELHWYDWSDLPSEITSLLTVKQIDTIMFFHHGFPINRDGGYVYYMYIHISNQE